MKFFREKAFIFTVIVILAALLMMALSVSGIKKAGAGEDFIGIVVSPFQKILTSAKNNISDFKAYITDYKDLKAENEELTQKVSALEQELIKNERYKEENQRLKGLLEIKETKQEFTFAMAEIISRDINNWFTGFVIDKGTVNGIAQNDTVLTNEGIVGVVSEVGTTWAKVSTIIEPGTTVGAIISRTGDIGIVEGNFDKMDEGLCCISYLPKTANVIKGDYVETSGLGGIFPKGLIIGTVTEVGMESHGLSSYAVIQPKVDFANMRTVFVITSYRQSEGD